MMPDSRRLPELLVVQFCASPDRSTFKRAGISRGVHVWRVEKSFGNAANVQQAVGVRLRHRKRDYRRMRSNTAKSPGSYEAKVTG